MSTTAKIITTNGITVYYNNKLYTISRDHKYYLQMIKALDNNNYDEFVELNDAPESQNINSKVIDTNKRFITSPDNKLCFITRNGILKELDNVLYNKIQDMLSAKANMNDMVLFLDNLYENPSNQSIKEAYSFLEGKNMPITEDGCFLAYKCVDNNFNSKTKKRNLTLLSGRYNDDDSIYNGIGEVIECSRGDVDDDRNVACGHGLHVGNLGYSGPNGIFHDNGDKVIIVKVNPKDIVSIPHDSSSKIRVCKYIVIAEYAEALPDVIINFAQYEDEDEFDGYWPDSWYDDDDDDQDFKPSVNDTIVFDYDNETRYALIKSEKDGNFNCILLYPDPSFDPEQVSYRNFSYAKMSTIREY